MNFKRIDQYALTCILAVFVVVKSNAQHQICIGLKFHPNISFSSIMDKTNFDKSSFSISNGLLGLNMGASVNFQKDKWIFEFLAGINSNRTGLKFQNNSEYAELNIRTISFTNEMNIGLRLFSSNKPYYEFFYTASYSYSFVGIQKLSGNSQFDDIISYQEIYPNLDLTWKSNNLGTGFKIRTQLKNGRKFDYGLSYKFGFKKYPQIGMQIVKSTQSFQTIAQPKVSTLNIDFIYYFGKNNK